MSSHRIVWYIACSAAGVAALVIWVRHAGEVEPAPGGASQAALVTTMMDRLSQDHPMDKPETKDAVRRVAELTAAGSITSAEAYYALGLWHAETKAFDAAEQAFRQCLTIRPGWSWPHNALGIVLGNYAQNRLDEAEQEFRTAIRLDPEWSRPHNDLAILLRLAGRLDEAEQQALLALRLDPGNVATHNNYGNLLIARKRLEQAETEYLQAISLDPAHPKPYYNLACVYALQNKKDDAIPLLQKAFALSPTLRQDANTDPDFDSLRDDPAFQSLLKP
ncbi:MAG TPA: tetratricopeptide repeat protein [Candidatus Bathyarchaeia archaeon]|nr:tetratricopeptide repeat protein [Candidatus Bathyarchaeia archaeon]